ncbi:MAG: hypothetical protein RJB13_2264 [Pseudomonadota bacterium]|jgi:hypothetical protein
MQTNKGKQEGQKRKKGKLRVVSDVNPHKRVQPMDEVPVDLGVALEQRMDTRTNARLLGIDGGVGAGVDSGSDLNSMSRGDTDENDYEPITDDNLLTETAYIRGVFQEKSVLTEDDTVRRQHQHINRTVTNKIQAERVEDISDRREEPTFTPPSRKKRRHRPQSD